MEAHPQFEEMPATILEFLGPDYLDIDKYTRRRIKLELVRIFGRHVNSEKFAKVSTVVMTGSIGWGKCVHPDTEIFDVSHGRRRRVGDIGHFKVASMDESSGSMVAREANAFPSGRKQCVRLALNGGQHITLSNDHPVFTSRGWVEAAKIDKDDLVATPRVVPEPDEYLKVTDKVVKMVAYLAADGGTTLQTEFTNADQAILKEFRELALALGNSGLDCGGRNKKQGVRVTERKHQSSGKATTLGATGLHWLTRKYGLQGKKATEKRVPAEFYGLNPRQTALFINRFMACDGSVYERKMPRKVEVTLASEGLIDDLRFMYLRLGIQARKYKKHKYYRADNGEKKSFTAWSLNIADAPNILRFFDHVGPIFSKEVASRSLVQQCQTVTTNTNTDIVPIGMAEIRSMSKELCAQGVKEYISRETTRGQRISRSKLKSICERTGYSGEHSWLAESDIFWERVRSIEDVGFHDVYDLSVDGTHCFVGNGIVVHNSFSVSIILLYMVHWLLCLKDPQGFFRLAPGSNICAMLMSTNREQAADVIFSEIKARVDNSPWFKYIYAPNTEKDTKRMTRRLVFAKHIYIIPGDSKETTFEGYNIIGGALDEGDSHKKTRTKDYAEIGWGTILGRVVSRFEDKGLVLALGQCKSASGFMSRKLREVQSDPDGLGIRLAIWESKDPDNYSGENFFFDPERACELVEWRPGALKIPIEYQKQFRRNPAKALKDLAGRPVRSGRPWIADVGKIREIFVKYAASHPGTVPVDENGLISPLFRCHDSLPRALHVDIGLGHPDAAAIAMGHIPRIEDVDGEARCYIAFDFIMRIAPPPGGEVSIAGLRQVIYTLLGLGFKIAMVTYDGFESRETIQTLNKKGIRAETLSVDRTLKPYSDLQDAILEGRLEAPPLLAKVSIEGVEELVNIVDHEARGLQYVDSGTMALKVDHQEKGSKETTDCMAGVVHTLLDTPYLQRGQVAFHSEVGPKRIYTQMIERLNNRG